MATKLKNMKLTSVDLVRAGANQEADICLYKSADPPEATESPTEEEKNIFKRFIAFIRGTPAEADVEPHSPIEKAEEPDKTPDLEYLYKSALAESLHSIMQDDTLTKADKKNMAERSLRQYADKIRELDEDEAMERELLEDTYDDDDLDGDFEDYYDFDDEEDGDDDDRYDDIEEVEVSKYNHNHGADGKFSSSGGGGGGAGGGKVKYASYADFPNRVTYDGEDYYKQSGAAGQMTTSSGGKAQSYVRWDDNNDEQYVEMNDRGEINRG